jgi:hypothetical protein
MKLSQLKANPKNPRIIRDDKFKKLVASIEGFPEMMEKRPMVCVTDVDGKLYPLGGNMRLRAIKDNASFGEWNYDDLANEWDAEQLSDWGVDVPMFDEEPTGDDLIGDEKNKPASMKITFTSPEQLQKAEIDIQELIDRKYQGAYFSVSAGEI